MVKSPLWLLAALQLIATPPLTANDSSAPAPISVPNVVTAESAPQDVMDRVPTIGEVEWLERRGREIADYDHAAWVASDLLKPMKPDKKDLGLFYAIKYSGRWFVYFGKMNEDATGFIAAYIFSCPEGKFNDMKLTPHPDAWPKDDLFPFALAVDVAKGAMREDLVFPPYNNYVFREPDGTITVYYMPGSTEEKVIRYGADYKLSISADGRRVLKKTQLHKGLITQAVGAKKKPGEKPDVGMHSHVISPVPTETDVAMALIFPTYAPQYIPTKYMIFLITQEGKVLLLGHSKDLWKNFTNPASAPISTPNPKE